MARANTTRTARGSKPTGLLGAYAETKKAPTALLGDVQAHLLAKSLEPSDRRQDVVHPSEMAKKDWCPRQTYYRIAGTKESDPHAKKFSFQLESIFGEGNDIHSKWQTWFAEMGRLWGHWKCLACGTKWWATSPKVCAVCEKTTVVYDEVPMSSINLPIAGHADGAVDNYLIELKSVGMGTLRMEEPSLLSKYHVETVDGKKVYDLDSLWSGLRRPLASHVRQANIYLWLARENHYLFDRMVFLYEFKANQSFKEFVIPFSEEIAEPLLSQAEDIKLHLTLGTPPDRPQHVEDQDSAVCKSCPYRSLCWVLNDSGHEDGELDAADGAEVPRSEAQARTAGPVHAGTTGVRTPRVTGRPDRARRQRPDAANGAEHPVGELSVHAVGSSGGGRKVRRTITRKRPSG